MSCAILPRETKREAAASFAIEREDDGLEQTPIAAMKSAKLRFAHSRAAALPPHS